MTNIYSMEDARRAEQEEREARREAMIEDMLRETWKHDPAAIEEAISECADVLAEIVMINHKDPKRSERLLIQQIDHAVTNYVERCVDYKMGWDK